MAVAVKPNDNVLDEGSNSKGGPEETSTANGSLTGVDLPRPAAGANPQAEADQDLSGNDLISSKASYQQALRQDGIFDINEQNVDKKIKELDNLINEIDDRIQVKELGLEDKFTRYDITFAISSGKVAYRVAEKLEQLAKSIQKGGLQDDIKIRDVKAYKGKSDEVSRGYRLGRQFKKYNQFQLPIIKKDAPQSEQTELAKSCIKNISELLELRSTEGINTTKGARPLKIKLPDGLNTSEETAKFLKDELGKLGNMYPGQLELREGDAKIDNPQSAFRNVFIRKSNLRVLDNSLSPEDAVKEIEKVENTLKGYEKTPNSQRKMRLFVAKALQFFGSVNKAVERLDATHQRMTSECSHYSADNLDIKLEGAETKTAAKPPQASGDIYGDDFDWDSLI